MSTLKIANARVCLGSCEILKGISVSVEHGQLLTLLGPSGCGKTTLLRAIAGFLPLDSGHISIDGVDMRAVPPERRNTAMCFQSYALFPHLTVFENIAFGLRQKKTPRDEITRRVQSSAVQVSLEAQLDKLPAQLSGGQQQRVALARALTVRPGIILFDEPLSNLDARLRDQVRFQIRQLQKQHGFTAVYVTHDQAEALAMSDLVVVMNNGQIEQIGTPNEVYYHPVNRFVANFVGTANILPVRVIGKDAARGSYRVSSIMGELEIQSDEAPIADHVYAMWRPEDINKVEKNNGTPNIFQFTVKTQSFLGNLTDLAVSTGNGEAYYRIQMLGETMFADGEIRSFCLAPDKLRFLKEQVQ